MRIAIIHDWLVTYAGAERVLEQLIDLYPNAIIFTLFDFLPKKERKFIENKVIKTSFIQRFPYVRKKYRSYIALFPLAIELFNLSEYDLIISSSHCVAKGVKRESFKQLHISYIHTPPRYVWDLRKQYLQATKINKGIKSKIANYILDIIGKWDLGTINRVDYWVCNSNYIKERIKRLYAKEATVIYPPVYIDQFNLTFQKDNFYLAASRMVPYKKMDLIVEAFSLMPDKKLIVIGDGPELEKVKSKATLNIEILGYQPFEILKDYMQRAKAFIFAAEEDFGIIPVEAQACGTPVIAYGKGGVLETVIEGKTGIFFKEQTVESLIAAVKDFEQRQGSFDTIEIRKNAERFSKEIFKKKFKAFVDKKIKEFFD